MSFRQATPVTPSDTVDVRPGVTWDALRVGTAGNVTVIMDDDKPCLIPAMAAGEGLRIAFKRVMLTGTTATQITAFKL